MTRVTFTPNARDELSGIHSYIAADSQHRADVLLSRIEESVLSLRQFPREGRLRPELAPGVRSIPAGNYIIFYTLIADTIWILHILHAARDLSTFEFDTRL